MVNLYSDTQTRPTPGMREAIAAAEVGDEQRGADPTVLALEERVAALLGHEAAVFLPSGTMCNQIAIRLHCGRAGDEIVLDRMAHPIVAAGGPAAPPDRRGGGRAGRAGRGDGDPDRHRLRGLRSRRAGARATDSRRPLPA